MAQFDLNKYDTVESRIAKFWDQHEEGRIITHLLSDPNQLEEVVVQAEIYANREDARPVATGMAFEKRGTSFKDGANVTSHLENCETSAIGRAFANWIFKAKKDSPRPSQEEMRKVNRGVTATIEKPQNSGLPPAERGEEHKEQIAAYVKEIKTLLKNADKAQEGKDTAALTVLCRDIAPECLEYKPDLKEWYPAEWKAFRNAVVTYVQRTPQYALNSPG